MANLPSEPWRLTLQIKKEVDLNMDKHEDGRW